MMASACSDHGLRSRVGETILSQGKTIESSVAIIGPSRATGEASTVTTHGSDATRDSVGCGLRIRACRDRCRYSPCIERTPFTRLARDLRFGRGERTGIGCPRGSVLC